MNLTLEQKYNIILEALHTIGSFQHCSCGCPHKRKPRIAGEPVHVWVLANDALKAIGEEIKIYDENCSN